MHQKFSRRACASLLLSIPLTFGAHGASAADLVVAAPGGIWEESIRKCVVETFEQESGKSVDILVGSPPQWFNQIAASPNNPPIDITFALTDLALDAKRRGLVAKIDPNRVPNVGKIPPQFKDFLEGHGVVMNYGAMGALYNTKTVDNPPKNWKEFVRGTLDGRWRTSIPDINYPGGGVSVLWLLANEYGGGLEDIGPGLEQVKAMLASGNMQLWSDPNQVLNALRSRNIDIAMYWDGRAWSFIDENKDFSYYTPEPGGITAMTVIQKAENGADAAWDFMNHALSVEPQTCFANRIRYGVTNEDVVYDETIANQITDLSLLVDAPHGEFASHQSEWVERWNKEVRR